MHIQIKENVRFIYGEIWYYDTIKGNDEAKEKDMRKRIALLCMIVFCSLLWGQSVRAASNYTRNVKKDNSQFSMKTEYGMGGLAFYDLPVLISVTVKCEENFTGLIRVVPESEYSGQSVVAYAKDISLAAGEEKTVQVIPAAIRSGSEVAIEIVNEREKVVYREEHVVQLEYAGSQLVTGIMSDDYSALSYFDGISLNGAAQQANVSIFELNAKNFPEDAKALTVMSYLIIDNFDTAVLSELQYDALKTWVQDGGVLILGLGSHYQNVLHGFSDSFLMGTLGNLDKKTVIWNVTGNESDTSDLSENISLNLDCVEFQLEGGTPFLEDESAYVKTVGKGQIVLLSYSMAMEPVTSSPDKQLIAKRIMEGAWTNATTIKLSGEDREVSSISSGSNVAKAANGTKKPNVLLYGFILFVYVIVVGPVLYLVLKAMNKREKIWIAIPIFSLVFTAIIYFTGMFYRINKPVVSTFTVVQLEKDAIAEKIYTNIICPKPRRYDIRFAKGYTGFRTDINEYSYDLFDNGSGDAGYDYMLKENGGETEVVLDNTEPFQETSFVVNKNEENNIGSIDSDLTCKTTGFEGTVTNNTCYDLESVVVTFEQYICLLDGIKKGETKTIDSSMVKAWPDSYTVFDIVFPKNNLVKDEDLDLCYNIHTMMLDYVVDTSTYNKGYIWAAVTSYQPDLIEKSDVKQAGCGVLCTTYTAEYADVTGLYYPSIDSFAIMQDGDFSEQDRYIYTEVDVTYLFADTMQVTELEKEDTMDTGTQSYMRYADVYAYNMETGVYEQIFINDNVLNGAELEKYMVEGMLMLKYKIQSSDYSYYVPKIHARGDE